MYCAVQGPMPGTAVIVFFELFEIAAAVKIDLSL